MVTNHLLNEMILQVRVVSPFFEDCWVYHHPKGVSPSFFHAGVRTSRESVKENIRWTHFLALIIERILKG